jgi:hypothetical protein
MKKKKKLSQDRMIKELIRDYPEDALGFFQPEILQRYGKPVSIDFHIQENKKHNHRDSTFINDITVIYRFANRKNLILTLVEHWSEKSKFDIHRFAQYLIDLDFQFPGYEKLPIALFTDKADKWRHAPPESIEISCLGKIFLKFQYHLIRMKSEEAKNYKNTKNKFIAALRSSMKWESDKKAFLAFDFIGYFSTLEKDIKLLRKHIDIIEYYFYLTDDEILELIDLMNKGEKTSMLSETILNQGIEKGKSEGIFEGRLKDARKMHEKGLSLNDIMDITELSEEDLKKAGIF